LVFVAVSLPHFDFQSIIHSLCSFFLVFSKEKSVKKKEKRLIAAGEQIKIKKKLIEAFLTYLCK